MKKKDLVKVISEATGQTQKLVGEILDATLEEIVKGVVSEGEVALSGFGKFESVERAERTGFNPQTKEQIIIPCQKAVKFKPAKAFKDTVRGE